MNKVTDKHFDIIFFIILFIAFYLQDKFSPFIADDYAYRFFYDESIGKLRIVDSLKDAIIFQAHDYMTHNGRFIVHTLTAYFCGKLGVEWFRIINSLIFVLFVCGVIRLIRSEFGKRNTDKYIIAFVLFLFMPCPGMIWLGSIAMCINYLWCACAITYFIIIYKAIAENKRTYSVVTKIIFFFWGLFVGSLQESFSLGVSAALFFYYCFNIKKFSGAVPYLIVGFWIGTSIVTFAPGNFVRMGKVNDVEGGLSLAKLFSNLSQVIFNAKLFVILCISLLALFFKNKSGFVKFISENIFYVLTVISCIAVSLVIFSGERQVTCIELCSFILIIKIFYKHCSSSVESHYKLINTFLIILFCAFYIPIYNNRAFAYNALETLYKQPVIDKTIVCPEYLDHIRKLNGNYFGNRFTQKLDFSEKWMYPSFSNYLSDGKNSQLVTAILCEDKRTIVENYKKYNVDGCYHSKQYKYFVIRGFIKTPITMFKEYYEPITLLGKVKRIVLNRKENVNSRNTQVSSYFDDGQYRYYILNERSYKVVGMSEK